MKEGLTMEKFIEKLVDVLDTEEEVSMETVLGDLEEWDSLSFVSFMAMANAEYGRRLNNTDIKACKTVGDLYNLVK